MRVEELWIGDELEVISSGKVGTFEGMHRDLLRVKIDEKIEYYRADQLRVFHAEAPEDDEVEPVGMKSGQQIAFEPTIDLHLDHLPDFSRSRWPQAMEYQKHRCKVFIDTAIQRRVPHITIIHGVGEGVLRSIVEDLLYQIPEVHSTSLIHQGGATEAYFKY